MRRSARILALYVLLPFCLLEAGVRLYFAIRDEVPRHPDQSLVREWRWVRGRLRGGRRELAPLYVHDPVTGWRTAPNLRGPDIRTNVHGMRNDVDYPVARDPERPRLLILGDSYAFGWAVRNEDTFASVLGEELLPGWDVMNLAVSATGTGQNLLMYEEHGAKFRPDIVLLGFYVEDFDRIAFSFRDYAKPMYVPLPDGSVKLTHTPVPEPRALVEAYESGRRRIGGWGYSYAWAIVENWRTTRLKRDRSEGSLPRRTLSGIMKRFSERVRADAATPIWVIFPTRDVMEGEVSEWDVVGAFAEAEANALGMPVLRLKPWLREEIRRQPDPPLWNPVDEDGHLSPRGNRFVAERILDLLVSLGAVGAPERASGGVGSRPVASGGTASSETAPQTKHR